MKQQRRNKKGERDVQGCDVDQSRGDARGVKERKKKEEKTHGETMHVCIPVCAVTKVVRSVKRKESDQRGDKTMEEAGPRQGVVGGTDKATEALCTLYLYCFALFLW